MLNSGLAFAPPATLPLASLPTAAVTGNPPVTTLRAATFGWSSATTRDPAGPAVIFPPRILSGVEVGQQALDVLSLGGRVALTVSEIELADADGWAAEMARFGTADGRPLRLRVVPVRDPQASDLGTHWLDLPIAFSGTVRTVSRTGEMRARVAIGDISDTLAVPLQPNLYGGTGGQDGGAELKGRPKPVALGRIFNLEPVPLGDIDLGAGSRPTYQVHWRAVAEIETVRVRGVTQTLVTSGTPLVGQARAFPALGLFQLGGAPDGDVRADVRGDTTPVFANTTAGILDRMLRTLGPQLGDDAFDSLSWALAEQDMGGEVGWFRGAEPTTALAAAEEITRGCGAVLAGGRDGRMRLFDPFASAAPQLEIAEGWILDLKPEPAPATLQPAPNEIRIEWGRNWSPSGNLAGSVAAADRERLAATTTPYARALSSAVGLRVARQRAMTLPGLYRDAVPAQARADRISAWVASAPRFFTLTTDRALDQMQLGSIVRIASYPAYGLERGMTGVVMSWREKLDARRLEITLAETLP